MSTTQDKIKDMFLSGQTLTSCGAAEQFITADLRKYISNLRKQGLDIVDKRVTSTAGKSYKEYRLRREGEADEKKEDTFASVPAAASLELLPEVKSIPGPEPIRIQKPFIQQQLPFST
jgi:hypothetical protein